MQSISKQYHLSKLETNAQSCVIWFTWTNNTERHTQNTLNLILKKLR